MALDPSIPLSVNPAAVAGPSIPQAAQSANALLTLQANAERQRGRAALQQVFSDPASLDASGNPTPDAMRKIMSVDPGTGIALRQNMLVQQQREMQGEVLRTKAFEQKLQMAADVQEKALVAYESGISDGLPESAARQRAQDVYTDGLNVLKQSGMYSELEQNRMPQQFDPMRARADTETLKDWQQHQKQERDEARENERLAIERERLAQGTPTLNAERDAETIAQANIAAQEKTLGRPLTDAEKAQVRQDARMQPKITEAQKKGEGDPASVEQTAKMIANYQMAPLTAFALRSPWGQQVMARVGELNPDYNATRYNEVNRAMTAFGSGKQGDTIRALNVATQHLGVMEKAADALNNKDIRSFNSIANTIAKEFGVAAPTTFDGLKQIVGTEIEKAVAGGIGAVADRDRLMQALATANSPQQLASVFKSFKQLMAGQAKGLKQQYEDATGFKEGPNAFDNKLLPETKRQLSAVENEGVKQSTPVLKSKSEYDALPSGSRYRKEGDPENSYRIKP